jgi:TP901 family phage tail tape measure protein
MPNLIEIVIKAKDESEKVIRGAEKTGQDFGKTMTKVGIASGLALAGIGIEATKMAAEYETSTTRLVTSAGESTKNIDMVRKGMLGMAADVGTSALDLSKGMYTVESAGYHGAAGLTVLKAAAQGAKDEGADLGTVANAVTDVLVDYHLKASDAANVTSQMVTAVSYGKTTFQDFSGAMHNILPLASAMHLSFADVSGVLAEMTAHGMSADQASQNMANAMRSLLGPTHSMQAEFKAVGTSADEVHQKLSTVGLAGTLEFLAEKAKGVSPNLLDQEAAMRKLIGTAPGLSVALMTTGENASATADAIKGIGAASADAQGNVKGFAEIQQTLGFKVDQLKASFGVLMIELGDKLIPVVKDVVDWMNKHHTVMVDSLLVLAGLAAAVATYTIATKAIALATGAWTAAQKLLNAAQEEGALTSGKLGAAMTAIPVAGAVVGMVMLGEKLGELAGVGDHTAQSMTKLNATFLDVGNGSPQATAAIGRMAAAFMEMSQRVNDNRPVQGLKDMDATLAQMVSSGHADQAKASVEAITDALTKQGVSLGYIHDQVLPKYNDALLAQANQAQDAASATDALGTSSDATAQAQQALTDTVGAATKEYDDAKKAAKGYTDTVDALYGKFGDLSGAQAAFTVAMANTTGQITEGKNAIDLSTEAGAKNFQVFEGLAKANADVASKMIETGSSSDDATAALRKGATAIDDLAAKSGLTKKQIADLNTELYGVPKVTDLTISANVSSAITNLSILGSSLDDIAGRMKNVARGRTAAGFAHGGEIGAAATGGDRSGMVLVGEQGPELVRLPAGSTVRSNPDTMAALAGGHGGAPAAIQVEWVGPPGIDGLMTLIKSWIRIKYGNGPDAVTRALSQSW